MGWNWQKIQFTEYPQISTLSKISFNLLAKPFQKLLDKQQEAENDRDKCLDNYKWLLLE